MTSLKVNRTIFLGVLRYVLFDCDLRFVYVCAQKKVSAVAVRSAAMLKVALRMPPIVNTTMALGMGADFADDVVSSRGLGSENMSSGKVSTAKKPFSASAT